MNRRQLISDSSGHYISASLEHDSSLQHSLSRLIQTKCQCSQMAMRGGFIAPTSP